VQYGILDIDKAIQDIRQLISCPDLHHHSRPYLRCAGHLRRGSFVFNTSCQRFFGDWCKFFDHELLDALTGVYYVDTCVIVLGTSVASLVLSDRSSGCEEEGKGRCRENHDSLIRGGRNVVQNRQCCVWVLQRYHKSFLVMHRNNFCIEISAPLRQLRLEYSSAPLVAVVTSMLTDICWVDNSPL
jgi:hypothetical protein